MIEYKKIEVNGKDIIDELFLLFDNEIMENFEFFNYDGVNNLFEIFDLCKKLEILVLICFFKLGIFVKLICRYFKVIWSICLILEWDIKVYNEYLELKIIFLDVFVIYLCKFCNEVMLKDLLL